MPKVHLSGQNRNIPAHALNVPIKNTFEQSNIRFQVDGHYLTDMSDKGIEKFIKKHVNSKSGFLGGIGLGWGGKDLDVKEVKAFLQAVAANADKMENFTFDLKDPELGLYEDDDITLKDIQHSFQLEYETTGSSNTSVSFVDAGGVQSDYKQAKTHETKQHETFKSAQQTHRTLQSELQSAQKSRDKIADRIGDKASQQLLETDNKLNQVNSRIEELNASIADVRSQLRGSGTPQDRQQELRLMLRGMEQELKELKSDQKGLKAKLEDNHGFWSFVGGGSSLEDLREANAKVEKAQQALNDNKVVYDQARARWQEAVSQREGVESGKSWAEVHGETPAAPPPAAPSSPSPTGGATPATPTQPAAPDSPASPAPANDPPANNMPVTPAAPPTAPPNALAVASENTLQQLLTLDPSQQLEALAQVPVEQRELVLKMADDYWVGGQPGNVFGLGQADFEAMQGLQQPVAALRLNALLSWEDSADTYLQSASDRSKADILAHLNQQLFDQQLAQQAEALKTRLSGPTDAPVSPAAAPEETLPTQANPGVTAGPSSSAALNLNTYAALSPDAKLQQFKSLSPADQNTVFQAADPVGKVKVMATLLSQGESSERVNILASSMSASDRQVAIQELSNVLAQTQGPAPQKTELNMVLGMLRQHNGTAPADAPPAAPATDVAPAAPAPGSPPPETPEVERPRLVVEDGDAAPSVAPTLAPPTPSQSPPVAPANESPAPVAAPVAEPEPSPEEMGQALLMELAKLAQTATAENPAHLQAFAGLSTEDKSLVFKVASPDIQAELLFAIGETSQTEERQQVLNSLAPEQKAALGDFYGELLPAFGAEDQEMVDAIRRFMTELGKTPPVAGSASPEPAQVPAAAPQPVGGSQTLGQTVSVGPDAPLQRPAPATGEMPRTEGGLDMSMKLEQLTQELNNKSWTGGLMNSSLVNELVDQIWERGTQENRQNLAKLMVDEDQADKLSFLVVDYDHSFEKVAAVISAPNFPVKAFMAGVDKDDRAGLILSNMAELATQNNALGQAAKSFVMNTLAEYKDGIDREGPIESAKKTLQQNGRWEQLPVELSKEMDHILNTIWN